MNPAFGGVFYCPGHSIRGPSEPHPRSIIIRALAVVAEVEPFALALAVVAERGRTADDRKTQRRSRRGPGDRHADRGELPDKLVPELIIRAAVAAERRQRHQRGADRPDDPAEPVNAEHIEAVVEP